MKLENQVCSLELAKKLKELGVKQESLYGWCIAKSKLKHNETYLTCAQAITHPLYNCHLQKDTYASAFTVAELGVLLPECILAQTGSQSDKPIIHQKTLEKEFYVYVQNRNGSTYPIFGDDNEANARAKMLIYLIENKLIEVPT